MGLGEFIGRSIATLGATMLVAGMLFAFLVSSQFAANMVNGEPLDDWWSCQKRAASQVVEQWKPDFTDGSR